MLWRLLPLLVRLVVGRWSRRIGLRISLWWVTLRLLVALLRWIALLRLLVVRTLVPALRWLLVPCLWWLLVALGLLIALRLLISLSRRLVPLWLLVVGRLLITLLLLIALVWLPSLGLLISLRRLLLIPLGLLLGLVLVVRSSRLTLWRRPIAWGRRIAGYDRITFLTFLRREWI